MVAPKVSATSSAGTGTLMDGFHVAVLSPTTAVALCTAAAADMSVR